MIDKGFDETTLLEDVLVYKGKRGEFYSRDVEPYNIHIGKQIGKLSCYLVICIVLSNLQ